MRKFRDQCDRALDGSLRLQWVNIRKTSDPREFLAQSRIMLHRARSERIEAGVNCGIQLRQPDIMADGLGFGETRKTDRLRSLQTGKTVNRANLRPEYRHPKHRCGRVRRSAALHGLERMIAGIRIAREFCPARRPEPGMSWIFMPQCTLSVLCIKINSASVLVSVTATMTSVRQVAGTAETVVKPERPPLHCGSPVRRPLAAAGRGRRRVNSLKKAGVTSSTPGRAPTACSRAQRHANDLAAQACAVPLRPDSDR